MGGREIDFRFDLIALDDFVQPGMSRVGGAIDNMEIRTSHAGYDQITALFTRIMMTG